MSDFNNELIIDLFKQRDELRAENEALKQRIKRLEDAGDKMEEWLIWSFGPQFKRHTTALAWIKSKESKS